MATQPKADVTSLLGEVLTSARYVVDARGGKTDVVLTWAVWQSLLGMLEDLDDRAVIRQWLPRLKAGPEASGALSWEDVACEWDEDEAVEAPD
jgi:hypothetical protein